MTDYGAQYLAARPVAGGQLRTSDLGQGLRLWAETTECVLRREVDTLVEDAWICSRDVARLQEMRTNLWVDSAIQHKRNAWPVTQPSIEDGQVSW